MSSQPPAVSASHPILAGMLMVVQSACNGMLEKMIDRPVMVGLISLSVGLTTLVIAAIATGQLGFPGNGRGMQGPWWANSREAKPKIWSYLAAPAS